MNDPTAAWHAEHVNFARLLDLLEKQVAVFHAGERPNYELMLDITSYLRHFPDRFHHPREDVAFARLTAHDAGLRAEINRLTQEHRVLATAGDALLEREIGIEERERGRGGRRRRRPRARARGARDADGDGK